MSAISVLHIASWFPNPQDERLGNFVEEHLRALALKQKVVILSAFENGHDAMIIKEEPFLQIQILYRKRYPLLSHYRALKKGYQYLKEQGHQFEMAHLHVTWPSGIVFLGFLKRLPFMITEHYSGYQKSRLHEWSKIAQNMARRIMNRSTLICPVSMQLGTSIEDFGVTTPQRIIGNVVDGTLFHYQKAPSPSSPFKLLHLSSLQEETKNIKGLLAGFSAALKDDDDLFLSIGGDGDLQELESKLRSAGIPSEKLRILPALSKTEVAQEMAACNAFVLFSLIENQPVVLLESLRVGRPVIATEVGGIKEFIGPEEGILVPSQKENALAQAILDLKRNYQNYQPAAIAENAAKKHSYQAIAEQFENCYTSVRLLSSGDH